MLTVIVVGTSACLSGLETDVGVVCTALNQCHEAVVKLPKAVSRDGFKHLEKVSSQVLIIKEMEKEE